LNAPFNELFNDDLTENNFAIITNSEKKKWRVSLEESNEKYRETVKELLSELSF
jgi:hypothetical protein